MSVRTADVVAQAEKARVFSLRDAFAGAPAATAAASAAHGPGRMRLPSATVPLTAASAAAPRPASAPALSLKFAPRSQAPKAPTNLPAEVLKSLPATNSIVGKRPTTAPSGAAPPPPTPPAPAPTFATAGRAPPASMSAPPSAVGTTGTTGAPVRKVYPATAESARADVMRLAALVDDLQRKLTASQTKATAAERNAAAAAQRATVDRNALSSKVHALQRELATAKDLEEKARIELRAVSNAKLEVDAAKTTMHEQEVMALQQTKAALLETLTGLQREHDGLKDQTQQLVAHAERKNAMARSKAESAAALEASAAQRVEAVRASEEAEQRRLEAVRAEVAEATKELAQLKEAGARPMPEAPAATEAPAAPAELPEPAPLAPAWTDDETRRAEQACGCCAYGEPTDLLGTAVAAVQDTAGGPARAPEEPADDAAKALACAVERDLLENFKANLYTNSGIPQRNDIASMYPVVSNKNGQSGYEGVSEKKDPEACTDGETPEKA